MRELVVGAGSPELVRWPLPGQPEWPGLPLPGPYPGDPRFPGL